MFLDLNESTTAGFWEHEVLFHMDSLNWTVQKRLLCLKIFSLHIFLLLIFLYLHDVSEL